ncbi:membrane protein containing HD superfamily hydrolase domain, YQFF ortholog [Aquipluma nitroreducens]|uniref:Membrane protein containing HD superfamily hydrolase domain, YQFF ortholog n=1 Tax=Aquipluma nitroreducens TaxID=2010828 RepID=A0A5K7SGE0_9BACT|nr:HDIG domain-containing metalloprotein [Aquipluma nitroreducens]BBE20497.1 membrane protein containing HD superfamily hydrolase domain, YQFF ortholog [Aquipluma nitroreducens]
MKKLLTQLNHSYHLFYLAMVFIAGIGLIFLVFPGESRFKYEFQKGSPWRHETLIAPFNFAILKTDAEVKAETDSIRNTYIPYFALDSLVGTNKTKEFSTNLTKLILENPEFKSIKSISTFPEILRNIYNSGILPRSISTYAELNGKSEIRQIRGNKAIKLPLEKIRSIKSAYLELNDTIRKLAGKYYPELIQKINLSDFIAENLSFDEKMNQNEQKQLLDELSSTKGMVQAGERIIFQGDLVGPEKYIILESLKKTYETKRGDNIEYFLVIAGRIVIIATLIALMFLYLIFYRRELFEHKRKLTFIIMMIVIMVFLAAIATKVNAIDIYMVPMAILPILVRIFFDSRTAIFSLMITTLLIGYFAPNSYEFIIIQMIAGIIAVFSLNRLHKRSHIVFSALWVFLSYSIVYIALALVQEGSLKTINWTTLKWFGFSSLFIFITYPLIYIFEKVFGFVSDVTLIELSNTNQPLLRKLAEEAPGTFQHSLQVANLAEAVIHKIGGNPYLVYAGALYHDIGKTHKSEYFIENQVAGMNPHDSLDYLKSAVIIIDHVTYGVQLARKYKLPEVLISFITTHHGTTQSNYFYKKYQIENPGMEVDTTLFSYPGPLPHNKEMAVLMLVDGIEATAHSLKEKSAAAFSEMIDYIVDQKIKSDQLIDADLTLRDITILKSTLLEKLVSIYHVRIEYPK